jgi:hypothetical protein
MFGKFGSMEEGRKLLGDESAKANKGGRSEMLLVPF